ncbi:MAG: UPF0147 family protein [archaeon]|nr:UPF0147 family protein [archaeon]
MAKKSTADADIGNVAVLMDSVLEDTSVPRNIRKAVEEAKYKILDKNESLDVRVTTSIYKLDDISSDVNMPSHARTEIWQIISELETIREKEKK